ncbi:MAG TPA: TVP38/TMEM64 family protein [Deltaproteobacteria bacterium]|nr:TVP38/TMEM64 family protein [Deltaproteobacteria bacterium]
MQDASGRERRISSRALLFILGSGTLVVTVAGVLLLREIGIDRTLEWVDVAWERLQQAPPAVYFGAMVLITLFPVPASPFYVAAGPLYGIVPSLLWIVPAVMLNNTIVHVISTSFFRPWLTAVVSRRGFSVPTLASKRDQTLFIAMVRITPGVPYFFQNILLGLSGVDLPRFLIVSTPVHMIYATGFVILGRSAFEGDLGLMVGALGLIVIVSVAARFAYKRFQGAGPLAEAPGPDEES